MKYLLPDAWAILTDGTMSGNSRWIRPRREGRLGSHAQRFGPKRQIQQIRESGRRFPAYPQWADAVNEVKGDFDIATGIILNPDPLQILRLGVPDRD